MKRYPPTHLVLAATFLASITLRSSPSLALDWPSSCSSRELSPPAFASPVDCHDDDNAVCNVSRELASRLATACFDSSRELILVPVTSPQASNPSPNQQRLTERIAATTAGALVHCKSKALSTSLSESRARALVTSTTAVALVSANIVHGRLRGQASLLVQPNDFWDRFRVSSVQRLPSASRPIDASVRPYLASISPRGKVWKKVPSGAREVLALHCETNGSNGALTVAVLARRRVSQLSITDHTAETVHSVSWKNLAPISPVPWRDPLGTVAPGPHDSLDVATTDRAWGVRLTPNWQVSAKLRGLPLSAGEGEVGCVRISTLKLLGPPHPCTPRQPNHETIPVPKEGFDTYAAAVVRQSRGPAVEIAAWRPTQRNGTLHVVTNTNSSTEIHNIGAQVALADLDLDGNVEVISSANVRTPARDALQVRTWQRDDTLRTLYSLAVPSGIQAVISCPPNSVDVPVVIVATRGELWLIR